MQIQLAPLMGYTDRHFRTLVSFIDPNVVLFSEMTTTSRLIYGKNIQSSLQKTSHTGEEIFQLGGSDPKDIAACAIMVEKAGYTGVNLNVGCPSSKVQKANIGACLYKTPQKVFQLVDAMKNACDFPVSVKCRLGVDDIDDIQSLFSFVEGCQKNGATSLQIHARKALLSGLSTRQNRQVPPLDYKRARLLQKTFPHLPIILNGGIDSTATIIAEKEHFHGFMIGRKAINDPFFFKEAVSALHDGYAVDVFDMASEKQFRLQVLDRYFTYCASVCAHEGIRSLLKPLWHVMSGLRCSKKWKKFISDRIAGHRFMSYDEIFQLRDEVEKIFFS